MFRKKPLYLKLVLRDRIPEDKSELPFLHTKTTPEFREIVSLLEAARTHRRIRSLALVVKPLSIGWGQIEELRERLAAFHASGKNSVCYLESGNNQSLYLASAAQRIFMPPTAGLDLVGLRAEVFYFRDLLGFAGVEPELFSIGEFKSASEIFTRNEMSEASRSMTDSILEDMQGRLIQGLAESRGVPPATAREWIGGGPYTARQAHQLGLIDGMIYEDEIEQEMKREIPGIKPVRPSKLSYREGFLKRFLTRYRPQIAYVVAEGIITQGTSRKGLGKRATVGAETLRELLESARESKRTKAVVLRINSPGGAAHASDLIWREVQLTSQKKPLVASFGNVAASGAYYLALGASTVLAMPGTLTGSIGVIGGKFSGRGLLDKLLIKVDGLDKAERAGYLSAARPFSEAEAQVVRSQMEEFYETFLTRVREGRRLSEEEVQDVSRGRVWTGYQANSVKLIDKIGGVFQAFEIARKKAGIKPNRKFRVVHLYQRRSWKDLMALPFLENLGKSRLWALPFFWWRIR